MRPTQAHFLRMTAAEESAADVPMEALEGYDLMLSTLAMHKRRLKYPLFESLRDGYKRTNIYLKDDIAKTLEEWRGQS